MDVKERCRRVERRAARISCTGGRRRRGRGALRSPSDRTRASRAKVASFAHHATLPNEDYRTEKSALFLKKDRLDGFRAKRADTAFRPKTRRDISRLQRRENGNHTPHSKPITHAHAHAGQQSSLRRKCIGLADPREQREWGFAFASSGAHSAATASRFALCPAPCYHFPPTSSIALSSERLLGVRFLPALRGRSGSPSSARRAARRAAASACVTRGPAQPFLPSIFDVVDAMVAGTFLANATIRYSGSVSG